MTQRELVYETQYEKDGGCVPFDPHVPDKDERIRLSKQAKRVLDRLREGPATNSELSKIALSYTRRISDLKEAGHKVEIIRKQKNGLNTYAIVGVHHLP